MVLMKGENGISKLATLAKFRLSLKENVNFSFKPSYHLYRAHLRIVERETVDRNPSLFIAKITRVISSLFDVFSIL